MVLRTGNQKWVSNHFVSTEPEVHGQNMFINYFFLVKEVLKLVILQTFVLKYKYELYAK